MKEAELQEAVIDCARLLGYLVAHFRPARTRSGWRTPVAGDGEGFPDLVLARRDGRLLVRELKVGRNQLTDAQETWLAVLYDGGVDVGVWRDTDWLDGTIERELRAIADPEPGAAGRPVFDKESGRYLGRA